MKDFRPILLVNGILLATLGALMLIPAFADLFYYNPDWVVFAASGLITVFVGVLMWAGSRGQHIRLTTRHGFLMTTVAWILLPAFGAVPFIWSQPGFSLTDAYFEAVSGITTTGATVFTGLDTMPPGILTWRAVLQWLGGLGIIVMSIAVLPMLQVGGMQLFKAEAFDTADKILPRASQIAAWLVGMYLVLTLACALSYHLAGMRLFYALLHSMSTVATGGFSPHDASIGHYNSAEIEIICIIFMILGSLPFLLYVDSIRRGPQRLLRDAQVRTFIAMVLVFTIVIWLERVEEGAEPIFTFRETMFNFVSVMTGTGFATTDFNQWGGLSMVVIFTAMCLGGCAGSTSCGIKTFRFMVLWQDIKQHLVAIVSPSRIHVKRYNGRPLGDDVSAAVQSFFFLYIASILVLAALLGMVGLEPLTAISGAATAISNVGPGLGEEIGPAGNFAGLPGIAKWLLVAGMILGRLELFSVLVLFLPRFWRG
ncbi:MAG: TrkH family potassium uptake protein [Rhodobiaceae bacterium]|nr:TrkH family potassium uptake protein [Rhodobiaceae bacterium]MCC0014227.1 TrkH family potassium uptake protein [Rhodobiaceae bacterium]MCC0017783.1 TrkH family potassium uptake protein [Rhodobiaceae bacterium]MCC0061926.1 TrkH family potassium uptake protein [Rhodobiaceae bacterium]